MGSCKIAPHTNSMTVPGEAAVDRHAFGLLGAGQVRPSPRGGSPYLPASGGGRDPMAPRYKAARIFIAACATQDIESQRVYP
ncbi:hypothetical protein AK812_SmicGene19771 [Symbiodinium microadriaticum]|uniref:Uncharacterized protein n=1 Tax=Symbiodinium microadriaticum TaxID=2951 RepID=A0A1Q9DRN9_SYMMI|nr:hypothetical protein AK812_SmicGene19771 [Symbiodinium microadriaticum]